MSLILPTLGDCARFPAANAWARSSRPFRADPGSPAYQDPDTAPEITVDALIAPKNLRRRLNMTQEEFADALGIPVATLRNWEQGRHGIDPAARSLLILIARDPEETLATLAAARAA
ncbi:MAG: helix-turn-helix domain-containing protein [Xanthobacteraceae bacterium]|jgi:ribosome-binding protein aMBF1 (putative translation factor)